MRTAMGIWLGLLAAVISLILPVQLGAQTARLDRLFDAMRLTEILVVMQTEGVEHATSLKSDLFPDAPVALWSERVAGIYDLDRMRGVVEDSFDTWLDPETGAVILDFLISDLGRKIVDAETETRQALLDPDKEAAAEDQLADMLERKDPRLERLRDFVEVNDLIDANVTGGLNANLAFYQGLADARAFGFEMTQDQMLAEVWAQEGEVRANTATWVYSYIAAAYQTLSDDELDVYIALSRSEVGQDWNTALFAAFDVLFADLSYRLGRAAGEVSQSSDL